MIPAASFSSVINEVVMDVGAEDLKNLVDRELGYDLVPILIASWKDVLAKNPDVEFQVAYTFTAPSKLRDHVAYTSTQIYPIRRYMYSVQNAARSFGPEFLKMWNHTT